MLEKGYTRKIESGRFRRRGFERAPRPVGKGRGGEAEEEPRRDGGGRVRAGDLHTRIHRQGAAIPPSRNQVPLSVILFAF